MMSDAISKESFFPAVPTSARVFKPNDGGGGETEEESNKNPRYKHEEAFFDLVSTKTEASSKPPNEKLHKKSPILHTATKYNSSGFMNSSNNGDSEIGLLKSKFEKFADYGNYNQISRSRVQIKQH